MTKKTTKSTKAANAVKPVELQLCLKFSDDAKHFVLNFLNRIRDLVEKDEISDGSGLGLVCAHIRELAYFIDSTDDFFDATYSGDTQWDALAEKLQEVSEGPNPWPKLLGIGEPG